MSEPNPTPPVVGVPDEKLSPEVLATRRRMEALAEEAKAKRAATGQVATIPAAPKVHRDFDPDIFTRFGLTPPTPEEFRLQEQQRKEESAQAARELERQARIAKYERLCPPEFREEWDWEKVPDECEQSEIEKVWRWKFGPRGLYIVGPTGFAKSRALYVLARRLVHEGHGVELVSGVRFAVQAGQAFGEPGGTQRWLDKCSNFDVWGVDDLGKRWTPATEDAFFEILDRRTSRERPVLITANYGGDDFRSISRATAKRAGQADNAKAMIEPMLRRLRDYCDVIAVQKGAQE